MRQSILKTAVLPLGVIALALVATGVILVYAHAQTPSEPPSEQDRLLPVPVLTPQKVDEFPVTTRYTGLVESRRAATLAFEPKGRVSRIYAREGETVEAGQALAELDRRRLKASLREIEGDIKATQATLALAREEEDRQRNLRRDGAGTQRDVDRAVAERRQRQGQLDSLKGRRDRVRANLDDAVLAAPFDGVIAERRVEQGDLVAAGTPAFRIIQPDNLEARIGLPARQARDYRIGDSVELMIGGKAVEGRILEWLPEIDPARRTLTLRVALKAESDRSMAGQMAHMVHQGMLDESGYVVPEQSLTAARSGLWALLVAEPQSKDRYRVRRIDVEWLNSEGGDALVRGPLEPEMRVISGGTHRVVPGQTVTIAEPQEDLAP